MNDLYILGEDGTPILEHDLSKWGEWFERERKRFAMQETIAGYFVSTVFLGIDHSFGAGPPLLWETMIFREGDSLDYQERYSTQAEAREGHQKAVAYAMSLAAATKVN